MNSLILDITEDRHAYTEKKKMKYLPKVFKKLEIKKGRNSKEYRV